MSEHSFNGAFSGRQLERIAFPVGGIGSGMFCLEGTGAFSRFSLRHRPEFFHEPVVFAAVAVRKSDGHSYVARVLEGPVPDWKLVFPWDRTTNSSGAGCGKHSFGLPRFDSASFSARFPFAEVALVDKEIPLKVSLTGWSPFVPGDADRSSLPSGAVEYTFHNPTEVSLEAIYSFHARNFMATGKAQCSEEMPSVTGLPGGFILRQPRCTQSPASEGAFAAWTEGAKSNLAWFRGAWFDSLSSVWSSVQNGSVLEKEAHSEGPPSPGGSLYLPMQLAAGETRKVKLLLSWYVPFSTLRCPDPQETEICEPLTDCYRPWYANRFSGVEEVAGYWEENEAALREESCVFADCFHDSSLPPEVLEAVSANLSILKSTTVLRQFDGRMWAWEGSLDEMGACYGSCTHVWNYAQAVPHLFPCLERTLRETEFFVSQIETGQQDFRTPLPIRQNPRPRRAAADGQLGGLIKAYRDWRIHGDLEWLRKLWPSMRASLEYCIETWDPERRGVLVEPQHNTYDIVFWGPNGMCNSIYLAALNASILMGSELGEPIETYRELLHAGRKYTDEQLFNGEFYYQRVQWKGLRCSDPMYLKEGGINQSYPPEGMELLEKEGPKYQYGSGCLSDGVFGEWMAWTAGLQPTLDPRKIESHLQDAGRPPQSSRSGRPNSQPPRPRPAAEADSCKKQCRQGRRWLRDRNHRDNLAG